jgi:hypothetical protein
MPTATSSTYGLRIRRTAAAPATDALAQIALATEALAKVAACCCGPSIERSRRT